MNGETLQLYNKLKESFAILKTQFDERWRAHDISSQGRAKDYYERFDGIKDAITSLTNKIDDVKPLHSKVAMLEKLVVGVIVIGILLGVWVRYIIAG